MPRTTGFLLATVLLISSSFDVQAQTGNRIDNYSWLLHLSKPTLAPVINPVIDQKITWVTDSVELDATIISTQKSALTYQWTQLSGPGVVTFSNPSAEDTTAILPVYGETYLLQLSVSDGEMTSTIEVTVQFDFLANYTNPQQLKLPANRVYPMGQKMMLTPWWARSDADLEKIAAHGFSMQGPQPDTRASVNDRVMRTAKSLGLRAAYKIVDSAGQVWKLLPKLDDGPEEQKVYDNIRNQLLRALNNSDYNDQIDIWLTGTEEISTRNSGNEETLNRYLENFKKIISENDPQQRPLWMSDVTGVKKSSMMVTHKYLDMVGPQIYLGRIDPDGTGYTTDAVMGDIARTIVSTAKELDAIYPGKYPHAATGTLDALYEPIPSRDSAAMVDKIVEHWMYLGFNNGMQGYQIYSWYDYDSVDTETWNWLKDAYYKHIKRLTDFKLDYAYLWGERRSDLNMQIITGPATVQGYPSVSMQNIQYGIHRYVIITNSAASAVKVEFSGFPKNCVKTLDIHEDKYLSTNGSIDTTLQPLDVRLYRFDPVDTC